MGREIRRVPADWVHPVWTEGNTTSAQRNWIGTPHPLYDEDYDSAAAAWIENVNLWARGEHPDQAKYDVAKYRCLWEWDGNPPDREYYRERKWTPEEATAYQMYETVSEGTPVSPVCQTKEDLIQYLVVNGDYSDQMEGDGGWTRENAEAFVRDEWAPSLMVVTHPAQPAEIFTARNLAEMPGSSHQ